jgi:PST family polysaccharide transporter/lipopolysaccharide exporter
VAFPAYSKLQDDAATLRRAFYRTVRVTLLVALPAGAGIAAVAPTFVEAFLGPAWTPAVPTLQLLAVYGMSTAFGSMFGEVWKAVGRPDLTTKFMLLKFAFMAVLIYPLTARYGVFGTAMAIVFAELVVSRPASLVVTARLIDGSITRMLRELAFPLTASLGMGATVWLLRERLALGAPIAEFALLAVAGVVVYAVLVAVLETQFGWGLRSEYRAIRFEIASDDATG